MADKPSIPGYKVGDRIEHWRDRAQTGVIVRFYEHRESHRLWTLAEIKWDEGVDGGPDGLASFQMRKLTTEPPRFKEGDRVRRRDDAKRRVGTIAVAQPHALFGIVWDGDGEQINYNYEARELIPALTPSEVEQAAARLRRGPGSLYGVRPHAPLRPEKAELAKGLAEKDSLQVSGAIVGDLMSSMDAHEEKQIGAIAQALHQAEKATTSFTHNLGFHRDIARKVYEMGVRFSENYWRVDESYTDEHGRRIHNRWPTRYDSEAAAQRGIDTEVYGWTNYDPDKGHTDRKREVHRER